MHVFNGAKLVDNKAHIFKKIIRIARKTERKTIQNEIMR